MAALGTYERISPDGRFILRSYSGAALGKVSLMELPASGSGPVRAYRTPLSNEAFPVQGSWRYVVDINGDHYRFRDLLRQQTDARALFTGGMTGFYAAASELTGGAHPASEATSPIVIRSLSWPQNADPDQQGVGPLQVAQIVVADDGRTARVLRREGPQFICAQRAASDGSVYALPMISIDGLEFSAIPQAPKTGAPSMRIYGLAADARGQQHPCDLRGDLGFSPGKAVFGWPQGDSASSWLTYSDLGSVYIHDRRAGRSFQLEHGRERVLASAFPGLTADGRVIYGAQWRTCEGTACRDETGYVVADPYQSRSWRAYWAERGQTPPRQCITVADVQRERARFAGFHGIDP